MTYGGLCVSHNNRALTTIGFTMSHLHVNDKGHAWRPLERVEMRTPMPPPTPLCSVGIAAAALPGGWNRSCLAPAMTAAVISARATPGPPGCPGSRIKYDWLAGEAFGDT